MNLSNDEIIIVLSLLKVHESQMSHLDFNKASYLD